MIKKMLKTIGVIFVLFIISGMIWGGFRIVAMLPNVSYATTYNDTLAEVPFKLYGDQYKAVFKLDSGFYADFTIDTGNNTDCFQLNSENWELFERLGYLNKNSRWLAPFPTNSAIKRRTLGMDFFKTYKVGRIPVISEKDGLVKNEIKGLYFVEKSELDYNLIGMPFLRNQIVEFSKKDSVVRFLKYVPSDYKRSMELKTDKQKMGHYFNRYAIPVEVNGHSHMYFIDSGSLNAILLPMADSRFSDHHMVDTIANVQSASDTGKWQLRIDEQGCAIFDGRMYKHRIYYVKGNGHETGYVVNPLLFFDEDFILDFKSHRIWFKQ